MSILSCFPAGGDLSGNLEFTYTGSYSLLDDGDDNWRVKFLTSGTFTLLSSDVLINAFLVGGGAGGNGLDGGGGGYTQTSNIMLAKNTAYTVVIGAGGAGASNGGTTSGFGLSIIGGYANGDGGSAGGPRWANVAGSDGSSTSAGNGQGTTTREFGEAGNTLYSGGGGGGQGGIGGAGGGGNGALDNGSDAGDNGTPNTGGGGGGGYNASTTINGKGGSGILIIRNNRAT